MIGLHFIVVYKKGALNGAPGALSRKPVHSSKLYTVSHIQTAWLAQVIASYQADPAAQDKLQKLVVDPTAILPVYDCHLLCK
jgi:hypothetical protein